MSPAAEGPTVSLSFANNFWGKDDSGVGPLTERMTGAKTTCDELRMFYNARAALEDEYARKLLALGRKSLGGNESGMLKLALDTVKGQTEQMGKQHQSIAAQMKTELEEPLAAFAGAMKERRKIVQNSIDKILKVKGQQLQQVNKTRDRYEQECLKIKGYLAQGHMVMGQEERKNKAKLEKTQINLATSNTEYENAVKAIDDTTTRWNREWKAAADKFQDLEEERIDFTKSSLWTFANIASTVCVSDDAACETVRLSLEKVEVEKDIAYFIKTKGTGQEIPDPPKYINFCRGDVDGQSEVSEDDNYSVAQFPRNINPAFRSSSPQPSTYESHHDPAGTLARDLGHGGQDTPTGKNSTLLPQEGTPMATGRQRSRQEPVNAGQSRSMPAGSSFDPEEFAPVPHDPYPMDGMTMLCRPPNPTASDLSHVTSNSAGSSQRPVSRDQYSDITSYSNQEPVEERPSPLKQDPERKMTKKKSGFFQNHSPFRRQKSMRDINAHASNERNSYHSGQQHGSSSSRHQAYGSEGHRGMMSEERTASPDPIDANANVAINVGDNVLPVTLPGRRKATAEPQPADDDPIVQALANLKSDTPSKQATVRISADRFHGIKTPAPGSSTSFAHSNNDAFSAARRGTPPPSYDQAPVQRLGVPAPACTSKAMKETSQRYAQQARDVLGSSNSAYSTPSRSGRGQNDVPRAASPAPPRSASPRPGMHPDTRYQQRAPSPNPYQQRAPSPNPYGGSGSRSGGHDRQGSSQMRSTPTRGPDPGYYRHQSPNDVRPSPTSYDRPASRNTYTQQPSSGSYGRQDGSTRGRGGAAPVERPGTSQGNRGMSLYEPTQHAPTDSRQRSKSVADIGQKFTSDGRPILHLARAMYLYNAAIPEEQTFAKGDTLAVTRKQDDGWWEAEVTTGPNAGQIGLVPSNYLQPI